MGNDENAPACAHNRYGDARVAQQSCIKPISCRRITGHQYHSDMLSVAISVGHHQVCSCCQAGIHGEALCRQAAAACGHAWGHAWGHACGHACHCVDILQT
jgi:hypothetical protein